MRNDWSFISFRPLCLCGKFVLSLFVTKSVMFVHSLLHRRLCQIVTKLTYKIATRDREYKDHGLIKLIQVVSRLVKITAGSDFLGLCDQKRSYKHVSDFGRLRSYGHFLIPVHALV